MGSVVLIAFLMHLKKILKIKKSFICVYFAVYSVLYKIIMVMYSTTSPSLVFPAMLCVCVFLCFSPHCSFFLSFMPSLSPFAAWWVLRYSVSARWLKGAWSRIVTPHREDSWMTINTMRSKKFVLCHFHQIRSYAISSDAGLSWCTVKL